MELGCNYGFVLAYCNGDTGVDWNERTIDLARILNPSKEFLVADIRELPFPDNHIDTVLLTEILEHLPWEDVSKAIKEVKRVARLKVLVTVPNGTYATPEATSLKHQWRADSLRQQSIKKMLAPWEIKSERVTLGFFMLEVVCPQ